MWNCDVGNCETVGHNNWSNAVGTIMLNWYAGKMLVPVMCMPSNPLKLVLGCSKNILLLGGLCADVCIFR